MSTDLNQTSPLLPQLGIFDLPANERLALAQQLIASVIAEETPAPLTPAQLQEIERRVAEHEAHPEDAIPGDVVVREIRARLAARRK